MLKLLALTLLIPFFASANDRCTLTHVREAMKINREHRKLYKEDGHTDAAKVLNKLIFLEHLMIPFSASLDRSVKKLQSAGVAMWCEDLVAMDTLPSYQTFIEKPSSQFIPLDINIEIEIRNKLKTFEFKNKNELYNEIADVINNELSDINYNCLARHFLEATARSLKLAQKHYDNAPEKLKGDVIKAEKKLMSQMARALKYVRKIDKKAAPLQARGIPVICQEMPTIPWQ